MATVENLFVYGTLAPGRPNEHVLAVIRGTWRPAAVAGALAERGWGAAQGYPGIILGGEGRVEGVVLSSDELAEHWDRLDEFEGDEYRRVPVEARLEDGSTVTAQIYVLGD